MMQTANLLAFLLNIFCTYAGGVGTLFGGKTNSQISKEYRSIVTPAGFAFSIWGLIFIGEGIFTVWQTFPAQRNSPLLAAIGWWWVAANVFQSSWTFAFAYEEMWVSAVFLVSITIALGGMYFNLQRPHHDAEDTTVTPVWSSVAQWWIAVFPFFVHFGWVMAASLVNINLASIKSGAGNAAQEGLAIASIALLALTAAVLALPKMDPVVPGVTCWALAAIGDYLLSKSNGTMQQGLGHYTQFDTATLGMFATAAFSVAGLHGAVSCVLTIRAAWMVYRQCRTSGAAKDAMDETQFITSSHSKIEEAEPVPDAVGRV